VQQNALTRRVAISNNSQFAIACGKPLRVYAILAEREAKATQLCFVTERSLWGRFPSTKLPYGKQATGDLTPTQNTLLVEAGELNPPIGLKNHCPSFFLGIFFGVGNTVNFQSILVKKANNTSFITKINFFIQNDFQRCTSINCAAQRLLRF
jgi:hypothetical protein